MTTLTFNAVNTTGLRPLPGFKAHAYAIRAALPDMPTAGTVLARALDVATRVAIAAVPFAVLGWMFIAR